MVFCFLLMAEIIRLAIFVYIFCPVLQNEYFQVDQDAKLKHDSCKYMVFLRKGNWVNFGDEGFDDE